MTNHVFRSDLTPHNTGKEIKLIIMGFIREPKGVDFVIAPSQTTKEDVVFISNYIKEHKTQVKTKREHYFPFGNGMSNSSQATSD